MKLSINEAPVATLPDEEETSVGALLDGLRRRGDIRSDEVVVGLRVNDRPWSSGNLDALFDARLDASHEVSIATDDLRGYGRRILTDSRDMLRVLRDAASSLAEQFRSGRPKDANTNLYNLLSTMQMFLACIYHVRNTCAVPCSALEASGPVITGISRSLDAIQTSQTAHDWPALASQLESELTPALDSLCAADRGDVRCPQQPRWLRRALTPVS